MRKGYLLSTLIALIIPFYVISNKVSFKAIEKKEVQSVKIKTLDTIKNFHNTSEKIFRDQLLMKKINHFIENDLEDSLSYFLDSTGIDFNQGYLDHFILNAIKNNNINILKEFLNRKINFEDVSITLSQRSAYQIEKHINVEMLKFIINENIYLFNSTEDSVYSIINAIEYDNRDIINYWLKNGCSKLMETSILLYYDEAGDVYSSPLTTAILKCDTILIKDLVENGLEIKPKHFQRANYGCFNFFYNELVSDKKYSDKEIFSVSLHWKAFNGDTLSVRKLIQMGADINFPDSNNRTPIFYTIEQVSGGALDPTNEKYELLKLLIKSGADVNHQDKEGITPLMITTQAFWSYGYNIKINFARYLIDNGASLDIKDKYGRTFWDHIIKNENITFIDYFSKYQKTPFEIRKMLKKISKGITREKRTRWDEWLFPIPVYQ